VNDARAAVALLQVLARWMHWPTSGLSSGVRSARIPGVDLETIANFVHVLVRWHRLQQPSLRVPISKSQPSPGPTSFVAVGASGRWARRGGATGLRSPGDRCRVLEAIEEWLAHVGFSASRFWERCRACPIRLTSAASWPVSPTLLGCLATAPDASLLGPLPERLAPWRRGSVCLSHGVEQALRGLSSKSGSCLTVRVKLHERAVTWCPGYSTSP